jgi:glycosyltransferase involved in cell wall biosynthesis
MIIGIDAHAAENDGTGNCTYIRNTLTGLKNIDAAHHYILYATNPGHPFYKIFKNANNFQIAPLPIKNPFLRIPLFLAGKTYLDSLDILHVQYNAPFSQHGKLVVTIHDLGFIHYPKYFSGCERLRLNILTKMTARKASHIITGSRFSRADISRHFHIHPSKIAVVPYGISPVYHSQINPREMDRVGKKYHIGKPYILTVGRLNPRKNLVSLVKAFMHAKQSAGFPHQLVIAGKRDYKSDEIIQSIKKSIPDSAIRFAGFIEKEDLPCLYAGAGLFLYLSMFEGVGLPVLEAMKCGTPVITSRTSSLGEITGNAGITVDPVDIQGISRAIMHVLKNQAYRDSLIRRGFQKTENRTPEKMAEETLKIYEKAGK